MPREIRKIPAGDPRFDNSVSQFEVVDTVEKAQPQLLTIEQIDKQITAVENARTRYNAKFDRRKAHLEEQRALLVAADI